MKSFEEITCSACAAIHGHFKQTARKPLDQVPDSLFLSLFSLEEEQEEQKEYQCNINRLDCSGIWSACGASVVLRHRPIAWGCPGGGP